MDGDETGRKKFSPDTRQPMRCTRATDAPWRQGTVTQPLGLPHGHGCAPIKRLLQSTVPNYLSRSPHIICRLFLTRSQISSIGFENKKKKKQK